jgi:hypothetical protein
MYSSKEAFERFFKWKKAGTLLHLTVDTPSGKPDVLREQQILFVDDEEHLVAFISLVTHDHVSLNFDGADFVVRTHSVEATRVEDGWVTVEEALLS